MDDEVEGARGERKTVDDVAEVVGVALNVTRFAGLMGVLAVALDGVAVAALLVLGHGGTTPPAGTAERGVACTGVPRPAAT